jgi:hypothetical protein
LWVTMARPSGARWSFQVDVGRSLCML